MADFTKFAVGPKIFFFTCKIGISLSTQFLKHIFTQTPTQFIYIKVMLSKVSSYIREVPLYFKFHVMPCLN